MHTQARIVSKLLLGERDVSLTSSPASFEAFLNDSFSSSSVIDCIQFGFSRATRAPRCVLLMYFGGEVESYWFTPLSMASTACRRYRADSEMNNDTMIH